MKKILIILILVASSTALQASEFKRYIQLEKEIQGDWLAVEYFVAQPGPELQQSIKSMSFRADNIVEWEYVHNGKRHKAKGRYGIYSFPKDQKELRQLPKLIVAPMHHPNALVSSHVILTLSEVELEFDCRFLQRWGKLIKAKGPDGKRVLFIRKENKISSQQPTATRSYKKEYNLKYNGLYLVKVTHKEAKTCNRAIKKMTIIQSFSAFPPCNSIEEAAQLIFGSISMTLPMASRQKSCTEYKGWYLFARLDQGGNDDDGTFNSGFAVKKGTNEVYRWNLEIKSITNQSSGL